MTREEAIKKVQWGLLGLIIDKDVRDALETLIPELSESEDERIRKAIRLILIATEDEQKDFYSTHGLTRKDCTDWLEKQKDKMTAEEFESSELFQLKLKTKYADGYQDGLAQKEQKPADRFEEAREKYQVEWSEEDESELTAVIYCVSRAIKASKDENERNSLLSAKKWLQDKLSFRVKSLFNLI